MPPVPSRCSSQACRAAIFWAVSERGSRMPIDAAESPDGDFYLVREKATGVDDAGTITALHRSSPRVAADPKRFERAPRHHPHHYTCPDAGKFRRKKKP